MAGHSTFSPEQISSEISSRLLARDTAGILNMGKELAGMYKNTTDSSVKADLYYFAGVCYLLGENYSEALNNLLISREIKKRLNKKDDRYLKCIYNIGIVFNSVGDYGNAVRYFTDCIGEGKQLYGDNIHDVVSSYTALIGALIEIKDYERVKSTSSDVLEVLKNKKEVLTYNELGYLYQNIGVGYARTADYAKSKVYLELSLDFMKKARVSVDQNYINLINNLAVIYGFLGMNEKESEFFEEGIPLAIANNSYFSFNLINSYAIELGNEGKKDKAEKLLAEIVGKARTLYGADSRYYINILMNYAEFIRDYMHAPEKSLALFQECLNYVEKHEEDVVIRDPVVIGYSLSLSSEGEPEQALKMIQGLLFTASGAGNPENLFDNPPVALMPTDGNIVKILRSKHEILKKLYIKSGSDDVLKAAAGTSGAIIALIDRMRISISEEESRIVLGDRYRDLYLAAINDFELCYDKTKEKRFLENIFEFSERCKVASLLAATREMNAVQFQIPPEIADLEKKVQREIGYINSRISDENDKTAPDKDILADLNRRLLTCIQTRDSLVTTFEKNFPGYYSIKYNVTSPKLENAPTIIGRNINYLNYVLSDSVLYLFLVNRRHQIFFRQAVDSTFFSSLRKFRLLISDPSTDSKAREEFNEFQDIGYDLYKRLIEPAREYFISNNLMISPDNLLSYIPFEVLLASRSENHSILYRELHYLMKEFDISYTYSVTFTEEIAGRKPHPDESLVAFAPVYDNRLSIDSLFQKRQGQSRFLFDLLYSRDEAQYVASLVRGIQYLGNEALESEYKKVAGKFGIIHLAMHTVLDDRNPMNSAMVFALDHDSTEDGLLHTYEVYGIPLRTWMVVLSSCNTGSGMLSTGEGVLSLARGFFYSGSQSVVMSMWEIDDRSGTDIIKTFYDNLKKGKSKSYSLKRARIQYLKNASQLRSHPYYWSSLVVYGENTPVFSSWRTMITISVLIFVVAGLAGFYFWRRKYS